MKKLIFLAFAALSFNAHAQLNQKWSHTQSLSGGLFKSHPLNINRDGNVDTYVSSNETINPAGDIQGLVTKYDATGNLLWNTVLTPAVPTTNFANGGIVNNWTGGIQTVNIVTYNTSPAESHLIKLNSAGGIDWNIVTAGINNVAGACGAYIIGRTPMTQCGAFQCNGVAVAKYDTSNGQQEWLKTKYSSGYITRAMSMAVDSAGNIIVCGKRALSSASPGTYDKIFVLKYSPTGTLLYEKLFSEVSLESSNQGCTVLGYPLIATETVNTSSSVTSVKLRKLDAAGNVSWTKTINNAELNGYWSVSTADIIATSTGIKCYSSNGALLWSDGFVLNTTVDPYAPGPNSGADILGTITMAVHNVNQAQPLDNYLIQLDGLTGTILLQKLLSADAYSGEPISLLPDTSGHIYLLENDTTPPYGVKTIKLAPCSEFSFSHTLSSSVINVNNATCNNGQITASWSGAFNSWPYLELWKGTNLVNSWTLPAGMTLYTFQNLDAGTYTMKLFDESCNEKDTTVTVKCGAPSSGLTTTNITTTSAKANWNVTSCSNTYRIQYRKTGTTAWTTVSSITNPFYTITGLMNGTGYQWHVATKCNSTGTAIYSTYSTIKTFQTAQRLGGNSAQDESYTSSNFEIEIAPNPVSDNLSFNTGTILSNATLKIYNAQGQLAFEKRIAALGEEESLQLDVSSLGKGIYLMEVVSGGEMGSKRFLKQ